MFEPPMIPLWAALLGGMLSLSGTIGTTWFIKTSDRKHEARQLARAIRGEISALISVAELRGYSEGLRKLAAWCIDTQNTGTFSVASREEYRAVYKANAGKLGQLVGKLPEEIAILYTQAASLQEDLKTLDEEFLGLRRPSHFGNVHTAAAHYISMADLIDDTLSRAKLTIKAIDEYYPR
jgi:hypothetical protein